MAHMFFHLVHVPRLYWWIFLSLEEVTAHWSLNVLFSEEPGLWISIRTSGELELGPGHSGEPCHPNMMEKVEGYWYPPAATDAQPSVDL